MVKNVGKRVGDDASLFGSAAAARHCVRLAGACLAIRKNSAVVALKDVLHDWTRDLIVHGDLFGGGIEDFIECVRFCDILKSAELAHKHAHTRSTHPVERLCLHSDASGECIHTNRRHVALLDLKRQQSTTTNHHTHVVAFSSHRAAEAALLKTVIAMRIRESSRYRQLFIGIAPATGDAASCKHARLGASARETCIKAMRLAVKIYVCDIR